MKLFFRGSITGFLLLAGLIFTGCRSTSLDNPPPRADSDPMPSAADVARFRIGQTVIVTFSGTPEGIPAHEEVINENGNISLPLIPPIHAEGKTAGELQVEIYNEYVPKYYVRLNVTVKSGDRVFYVGGEVKGPGRQLYNGDITVTKAIQSAGGLTEYASHKKVWVVRASNGQRIKVDYDKALQDPSKDLPIYPEDQITVERTLW
jgi:polysaccharide export outer membrane protein